MNRTSPEDRRPAPPARRLAALRFVALLLVALLATAACRSAPRQTATVVRPQPVGAPAPDVEPPPPRPGDLSRGEALFAAGDLAAAAAAYEAHLAAGDGVSGGDLALFRLALVHLLPESPLHDPQQGAALLGRLLDAHPGSPFASSAAVILDLRRSNRSLDQEVVRLRDQLEELRRIDLGAEKKDPD